ncbi:probable aspartic protease At2g35615 [Tripterygium wilfordii]|uniref:probable aspartic protease At2g35615 n=1 Tax=Tripterygium wilfordii TaxID=458696 RepID=UPI0018F813E5|nr:probable aspartic protease At2g35615 [Tripterygium wilfordii]
MHRHIFISILISLIVSIQSLVGEKGNVISIDLIHRDSMLSPFYNRSISPSELLRRAVLRSLSHANNFNSHMHSKAKDIQSEVTRNEFEYLMKIYIGENHYQALALVSTGSQLVWIQCDPCKDCYEQDAPPFKPSNSYQELPYDNEFCRVFEKRSRVEPSNQCEYKYVYEKNGFTVGVLGTETFYFDSANGELVSLPKFVFGCGHKNKIKFGRLVQGVVGLGRGKLSLISQLGSDIEHILSYCLVSRSEKTKVSKLKIGQKAKISGGRRRVSTPLSFEDPSPYYYLTLEGISVGTKKIVTKNTRHSNIIIDSGTVMTVLHPGVYDVLEKLIIAIIKKSDENIEPTKDPSGTFSLCYDKGFNIKFPTLIFHFSGADVHLKRRNTYVQYFDYICMTIARHSSNDAISIFGSSAQVNFEVEYDLNQKLVSFAQTDCSQY